MIRPRLSYANVVSTLCLFLLLGGAAYAATQLPKNSVGSKQLKANAVTGAKVKNGSLTGADLNLPTLGTVPSANHATSADSAAHAGSADRATRADSATHASSADSASRAADASALGGLPASSFLPASHAQRIEYDVHWKTESGGPTAILTAGPLTLRAICFSPQEPTTASRLQLSASGSPGATIDYSLTIGSSSKVGVVSLSPELAEIFRLTSLETEAIEGSSTLVYRDATRTVAFSLGIHLDTDDGCRVSGTAIESQ